MKKEIGSEFWCVGRKNSKLLLSGRTALEYILCDILREHNVDSALLPSYCCHTMIEPFCRHNILVRFYDVFYDPDLGLIADVPEIKENEIFYYITYFGFKQINDAEINERIKSAKVIIEDCTHSWLSERKCEFADYSYVSYRKWTGFSGVAKAIKRQGEFQGASCKHHEKYCELRRKASNLKSQYIEDGTGEKQIYLSLFEEAEETLEKDYSDYLADPQAVIDLCEFDGEYVKSIRRHNAEVLIDGIRKIDGVDLIYSEVSNGDVPLFVPIFVKKDRQMLRNYLTKNSIYCPAHWPISNYHNGIRGRAKLLYDHELSLVCDQRYNEDDMKRIVEALKAFYKG